MERKHEQILQLARKISAAAREEQVEKRRRISEIGSRAFRVTAWLSALGILLGVLTLVTARNIAGSITQLKLSTREISEGKFDDLPRVRSSDELGDLSQSFQEMALRLKQLEATYLDANPLTRLPGGVAIEQKLKTLLAEEAPLAFCLADLRNFKAFNDRYGYARGNEVILGTAEIIRSAVKEHGREGDFIGHVGGMTWFLSCPRPTTIESAETSWTTLTGRSRLFTTRKTGRGDASGERPGRGKRWCSRS